MNNPRRVKELELDGKSLELRATFGALAAAERASGQSVIQLLSSISAMEVGVIRAAEVMAAVIKANGHKITLDEAGEAVLEMGLHNSLIWLGQFLALGLRTSDAEPVDGESGEAKPPTT